MRVLAFVFTAFLVTTAGSRASAGDDHATSKADSAAAQMKALKEEFAEAMNAFYEKVREIESDEERQKLYESEYPDSTAFAKRVLKLADENAGTDIAAQGLCWIIDQCQDREIQTTAIERVAEDHIRSPLMKGLARSLLYSYAAGVESLLKAIAEQNPDREVQGTAALTLGQYLNRLRSTARKLGEDKSGDTRLGLESAYGKAAIEMLATRDVAQLGAEAMASLERVVADYGDVTNSRGALLADSAKGELFEMRHLDIGMVAPEIEGEDIFGETFQLADYRGKVVVLDFWGHW